MDTLQQKSKEANIGGPAVAKALPAESVTIFTLRRGLVKGISSAGVRHELLAAIAL
jgi:hypothetical protein